MSARIFNFSAGPAVMPEPVLERARAELLNFNNCGMSVLEMSHRSPEFEAILAHAERGLRKNMGIPNDYAVLFLQGGASLQFAMVPMNLYLDGKPVDVLHTGVWTEKAIGELQKVAEYRLAASTEAEKFRRLPRADEIRFDPKASYVHLCSNNTIFGTQWRDFPVTGDVPLVADMSSDILARAVDVSKFGLIFAGAQKNIGPAGVTIVIIRKDLAERVKPNVPTMLKYQTHLKSNSLYNTPPTFAIYMVALVMDWIEAEGGVVALEEHNEAKARLLYSAIDSSGFYYGLPEKPDRSTMNVVFRIHGNDEALEKKFAQEAEAVGLSGLKGHRSTGGLRASIYNAMSLAGVEALVEFMREFERRYG
jgi:phosphoserine aminotransferase